MKSGKTEDFVNQSDEKLRQIPAYSDPENIFRGLSDLSNKLLYGGPDRSIENSVSDTLKNPDRVRFILENSNFPKNADVETIVKTFHKDAEKEMDEIEIEYFKRKFREYAEEIEGGSLESSVQTSKFRADFLPLVRSSPPMYRDGNSGTAAGAMKVSMRYSALSESQRNRKIEGAETLMRVGLRDLERVKSEFPVLRYDDNPDDSSLELASYYERTSYAIRKLLQTPYELLLDMADTEENPRMLEEVWKNLCENEMHLNFERGLLTERYEAFHFLASAYNTLQEEIIPHIDASDGRILINNLMRNSKYLQIAEKYFQNTIVAIDEADSLDYRNATLRDRRTRSEESIRRIEKRSRHLDGMIALNGSEWIKQVY